MCTFIYIKLLMIFKYLCVSAEDQHSKWIRQTLLLPTFHLCCGYREYPSCLQWLSWHHSKDASPPVWAFVIGCHNLSILQSDHFFSTPRFQQVDVNYWLVTMFCDFFSLLFIFSSILSPYLYKSEVGGGGCLCVWCVVFCIASVLRNFNFDFLLAVVGCGPANPMEICGNIRQRRLTFDLWSLLKVF